MYLLCLSSVTCLLKYWNSSGYCWCMVLAFANRRGCGGSLWPERLPRKIEQCYMKPEPRFNFQEAWALLFYKTFQIWTPSQRSSFSVSCLHFWVHSTSVFSWPPDTTTSLCISDHAGPKFDIDMLVSLLRQENARDICVIKVPPEMKYTDYFVIGSGTSTRHLHAMAHYIVKMVGCFLFLWNL